MPRGARQAFSGTRFVLIGAGLAERARINSSNWSECTGLAVSANRCTIIRRNLADTTFIALSHGSKLGIPPSSTVFTLGTAITAAEFTLGAHSTRSFTIIGELTGGALGTRRVAMTVIVLTSFAFRACSSASLRILSRLALLTSIGLRSTRMLTLRTCSTASSTNIRIFPAYASVTLAFPGFIRVLTSSTFATIGDTARVLTGAAFGAG